MSKPVIGPCGSFVTGVLTMNQAADKHAGLGSIDKVFEGPSVPPTFFPNSHAPSLSARFPVNAFHSGFVASGHAGIPHVLEAINDAQILSPVVERVSVDVIDLVPVTIRQTQDKAMQEDLFSRGVRATGNRAQVWSGRLMSSGPPTEVRDAGAILIINDELNPFSGLQRSHESMLSGRTQNV